MMLQYSTSRVDAHGAADQYMTENCTGDKNMIDQGA